MKILLGMLLLCSFSGSLIVAQDKMAQACQQVEAMIAQCDELLEKGKAREALSKAEEAGKVLNEVDPGNEFRQVMALRWKLALLAGKLGLAPLRIECWQRIVHFYEGVDADENEKDRDWLQQARAWLGIAYGESGELRKALKLQKRIIENYKTYCGPEDPRFLDARSKYSITLNMLGEMLEAKGIQEDLLATWEKETAGKEQLDDNQFYNLNKMRLDLANTLFDISDGRERRSYDLRSQVVAGYEKRYQEPDAMPEWAKVALATARVELSSCCVAMRKYERARRCLEQALGVLIDQLHYPEHNLSVVHARMESAYCQHLLGDFKGSMLTSEASLQVQLDHLEPGALSIHQTRSNLARLYIFLGNYQNAADLSEATVRMLEKQGFGDDNWVMQNARTTHASALLALGKAAEARKIMEDMVTRYRENRVKRLAPSVGDLACTLLATGELELADETFREGFEALGPTYYDFSTLSYFRRAWALTLSGRMLEKGTTAQVRKDARNRLTKLLREMIVEGRKVLPRTCALSPREVGQVVGEINRNMSVVQSLAGRDTTLQKDAFAILESARGASLRTAAAVRRSLTQVADLQTRAWEAIWKEGHLVSQLREAEDPEVVKKNLREARANLEAVMRDLLAQSKREGLAPPEIDLERIANALPEESAAVAYRRFSEWSRKPVRGRIGKKEDWLAAYVVRKNGKLAFKKLVRIKELRDLVTKWRRAIGKDVDRGTGSGSDSAKKVEQKTGLKLYELVLKPVIKVAGKATVLHVCLDDALHLVPLDALPVSKTQLVCDRLRIRYYSSFDRLVQPAEKLQSLPSLLCVGGVNYNQTSADPATSEPEGATMAPPRTHGRGPERDLWPRLRRSLDEAQDVREWFLEAHAGQPTKVLSGTDAAKSRVMSEMTQVRFIHVATHGYFEDWIVEGVAEDDDGDQAWRPSSLEEAVIGLTPMACCGLVLAGANKWNETNPALGVITAEELAHLDLSRCELATLSACNTNRGVPSSGQGIQSLQTALHAAGARTAITSLWKVDDTAARELMGQFYGNLFTKKMNKVEALEKAKRWLRQKPDYGDTKSWAGWVLTGDA